MPATSAQELLLIATVLVFGGLGSLFWIWMLVDCLRSLEGAARVRWALLIAFTHWLGAGIYFLFGRNRALGDVGTPPMAAHPPDPSLRSG
ncbi:MAG TPA: PLD nuclease N-terminal domain-containing protein [Solirubrobacterales bacterium]|nr:PLD nuclease N-terminal domain-containing protein [Solirubrobacterales bacterium]